MAVINIRTHKPKCGGKYFLDCNVLMYVFYLNGSYASDLISAYSELITKIINSGAHIYICEMLVSEFVNTYIQTEFHRLATLNGWPHRKQYFKNTFKFTEEYRDMLKEIKCILERQLFPISKRKDSVFSNISISDIFENPETFDFNDRYYGRIFENEGVYIVTNDADFSNISHCDIITNNVKLLNAN